MHATTDVLSVGEIRLDDLRVLLTCYRIELVVIASGEPIPASFWGEPEAGIRGDRLYARADTPLHSVLHEAAHMICMSPSRRARLDRNAGSDDEEECAVCYLQIVLADQLPGYGRERCCDDMDRWGYSFREGSVRDWLAGDGAFAKAWLQERRIV